MTNGAGVYAFSRVDRDEKVEYLVAVNNANEAKSADVPTLTAGGVFTPLYGTDGPGVTADAAGVASVTVPARGAIVLKADRQVTAPEAASAIAVDVPASGAGVTGVTRSRRMSPTRPGRDELRLARRRLRRVDLARYRRRHHAARLPRHRGLAAERSSSTARSRRMPRATAPPRRRTRRSATPSTSSSRRPEPEIGLVTVPGSHNSEMGCGRLDPGCEAPLTKRADGIYAGTFQIPPARTSTRSRSTAAGA